MLDLLRPLYRKTASNGHFGRDEPELAWERTDRADALRDAAGLSLFQPGQSRSHAKPRSTRSWFKVLSTPLRSPVR
jgi:hypothetical protein